EPLLAGGLFPSLRFLGLRNFEEADALAGRVASSALGRRLEGLDLSLGNLSDEGARAPLGLPRGGALKKLDVRGHRISRALRSQLRELPWAVDDRDGEEPYWVFSVREVTERQPELSLGRARAFRPGGSAQAAEGVCRVGKADGDAA